MLASRTLLGTFTRNVAIPAIVFGVVSNLLSGFLQTHFGILGAFVAWRWSQVLLLGVLTALFWAMAMRPLTPVRAPTSLDGQALSKMRGFFRVYVEPAHESEKSLLDQISTRLIRAGGAERSVGILVQHSVADAAHNSFAAIRHALGQPVLSQDLQQDQNLLGDWYRKYQGMTTWIHQGASHLKYSLDSDEAYKRWRGRDQKLLTAIEEMISEPDFETLREHVLGVGWGESFRERLEEVTS